MFLVLQKNVDCNCWISEVGGGLLRLTSGVAKNFRKKSGNINYKIHRVSAGVFHSFDKIFLCHRKAKSKGGAGGGEGTAQYFP